jgi:GNAT superfamily N-acetyltransferase
MSRTSIRQASPRDAHFLGWAILSASRGHLPQGWFELAVNRPEGDCLAFLRALTTTTVRSRWHYSRFLIAEVNAEPVAALSAFRFGDTHRISPLALIEAADNAGIRREEQDEMWKRGSYMFTCTSRPDAECWVIESIATLPQYRRCGYTSALLARTLEDANTLGLREAEITIVIGNDSAARAYQKAGFEWAGDRCHPEFEAATGAPGQRRFVKSLPGVALDGASCASVA